MNIAEFGIIMWLLANNDDDVSLDQDTWYLLSRLVTDFDRSMDSGVIPKVRWERKKDD